MLNKIKLIIGIDLVDTSKDTLLTLLIEQAEEFARNIIRSNNLCGLSGVICKMVVYAYNRLGTEGLSSESYSGATFSYDSDLPEDILAQLRAKRHIGVIHD